MSESSEKSEIFSVTFLWGGVDYDCFSGSATVRLPE